MSLKTRLNKIEPVRVYLVEKAGLEYWLSEKERNFEDLLIEFPEEFVFLCVMDATKRFMPTEAVRERGNEEQRIMMITLDVDNPDRLHYFVNDRSERVREFLAAHHRGLEIPIPWAYYDPSYSVRLQAYLEAKDSDDLRMVKLIEDKDRRIRMLAQKWMRNRKT